MPTEAPAYTLLVAVAGQPLPEDVSSLLAGGFVDNSLNVPDMFVLHFSDPNGIVAGKAHFEIGAEVTVSVQPTSNDGPQPLLTGEITALETDIDSAGKHLIVRGFDKSHRFFHGTRVAAYVNVKPGDIASQLAQQGGLQAGTITSRGTVLDHVIQPGVSDWDFLGQLAASIGAEVSVVDGKLNFADPVDAGSATSSEDSTQSPFVIEFGRNLTSLRATVTAAEQVPKVEVRGWDPATKQAVTATADAATKSASLTISPSSLAGTVGASTLTESNSSLNSADSCQNRADALANRFAGSFAELDGVANGNPKMKAGKPVSLANVGTTFDGKYTLSSTRHDFTAEGGYRTLFTVSNTSDRSFYGVTTGAGGGAQVPAVAGALTAVVTDLQDPDGMGRVKVEIPVLADDLESFWARVVSPGAGDKRGTVWLPEVGDEVLVVFGMGHIDEIYVLGGLFNGQDQPDKGWGETVDGSGQVQRRAWATRTGMYVELVESSSEEKIVISAGSDSQKVTIMSNGDQSISIQASGPVHVTTDQDATVDASSGSLTLKGQSISLHATSSLELKGATVKIAGDGSAELSSSGTTAVKGSMVAIN